MLSESRNHRFGFFARHLDQHGKARMTFHQSRNVTVLSTGQQIAFPMTRKGSVFRFRRPLADRNRIDDLPQELDRPDDLHGELPPGTLSSPPDPDLALTPESSNPKRSLGRCPLASR